VETFSGGMIVDIDSEENGLGTGPVTVYNMGQLIDAATQTGAREFHSERKKIQI